jgi:methylated-DNA-[protein]-cysteine S-methyltransferase
MIAMPSTTMPSPVGMLTLYAGDGALSAILFENEKPGERVVIPELSSNGASVHFSSEEKQLAKLKSGDTGPDSPILKEAMRQLEEYFDGRRREFDLPLGQAGSVFQQRVWAELCRIPFGKTISYLQLARRLGDEKCIRAAGSANGKNALAIVVPCHRVIGSSGDLVGYGGQLWRKKWLLEHEQKLAHGVQTLF